MKNRDFLGWQIGGMRSLAFSLSDVTINALNAHFHVEIYSSMEIFRGFSECSILLNFSILVFDFAASFLCSDCI